MTYQLPEQVIVELSTHEYVIAFDVTMWAKDPSAVLDGYMPMARAFRDRGWGVIFLGVPQTITDQTSEILRKEGHLHFVDVGQQNYKDLDLIDIFFVTDNGLESTMYPEKSVVVLYLHSTNAQKIPEGYTLPPKTTGAYDLYHVLGTSITCYPCVDFFVMANPMRFFMSDIERLEACAKEFIPKQVVMRQSNTFGIIPGGHIRTDGYVEYLKTADLPDSIIILPTGEMHKCQVDFVPVIQELLKTFDQRVIYRPTPTDRGTQNTARITAAFADNERVHIDLDSNLKETYARGRLLITDASQSTDTFSFCTNRPSIRTVRRMDPPAADQFGAKKSNGEFQYYKEHVYYAPDMQALMAAVAHALENAETWKSRISKFVPDYLYNVGSVGQYLCDNADALLGRKRNPDWKYYDRSVLPDARDWKEEDFLNVCESLYPKDIYQRYMMRTFIDKVIELGRKSFPESTQLAEWQRKYASAPKP